MLISASVGQRTATGPSRPVGKLSGGLRTYKFVRLLSNFSNVRATLLHRQDFPYTLILKPLTPGNSLT